MAKGNSSGCIGVVIGLAVLLGFLGIAAVFYLLKVRTAHNPKFLTPGAEDTDTLVFQEGALPRFTFPQSGNPISREQFVAFMIDEDATELSKESFRKVANQARIRWNLQTRNIAERGGVLRGEFELPWEVRREHGSRGSAVYLSAEFRDESRAKLLNLRRGDWVVVEGELSFDGDTASINDARLPNEGN